MMAGLPGAGSATPGSTTGRPCAGGGGCTGGCGSGGGPSGMPGGGR